MKNNFLKLIAFLVFITTTFTLAAQKSKYGFRLGLNASELYFKDGSTIALGDTAFNFDDARFGLAVGFFGKFELTDVISIQPELQYSAQGEKTAGSLDSSGLTTVDANGNSVVVRSDDYFKINVLQLPILVNFEVADKVELSVGPQFGFTVWEWERDGDYEFASVSALAGVTYNFTENISSSLRVAYGLTNILDADNSSSYNYTRGLESLFQAEATNNYLQLSVAYSL